MGEAKRRKLLDPNYGKGKNITEEEELAFIFHDLTLGVLIGIELWRKANPTHNWKMFFLENLKKLMRSPCFPDVEIETENDSVIVALVVLQTVLICNPPLPFANSQTFVDFLGEEIVNMNDKDMADLMNRNVEARKFILDCGMQVDAVSLIF